MRLILGLLATLCVIGLVHYYMWARLVRDLELPRRLRRILTGLVAVMGVSLPVGALLRRAHVIDISPLVMVLLACWGGFLLITLGILLLTEATRWGGLAVYRATQGRLPNPERRLALQRMLGGAVTTMGVGASGVAMHEALTGPQITTVEVPLRRLPKALSGFTIAQISDLHIAPLLGRAYVERVVATALAHKPDLIAITGDLVDGPMHELRDQAEPLGALRAPHGTYFVTGNHEYYSGVEAWLPELSRLGIHVMRNERVQIGNDKDGFDLAGIDDISGRQFSPSHGADLQRALNGRDSNRELVLLAHQPKVIFEAAAAGVGLMLCGHTHAGQIWPLGWFVRLVQPYVQGLALHDSTYIYVNRGTGYVGPPMRLAAEPELTLIRLTSTAT